MLSPDEIFNFFFKGLISEAEARSLGSESSCLEEVEEKIKSWKSQYLPDSIFPNF